MRGGVGGLLDAIIRYVAGPAFGPATRISVESIAGPIEDKRTVEGLAETDKAWDPNEQLKPKRRPRNG